MLELDDYLAAGTTNISNLILTHYYQIGLSQAELILYLQLTQAQQKGDDFPDLIQIATVLGLSNEQVFSLIQNLIQKKVIKIITTQTAEGKTADAYDLTPVFNLIKALKISQEQKMISLNQQNATQQLYQTFEQEFGRSLSPIELETIGQWLETDGYQIEVIQLALREAVLNQAYSLKYIDRILLNWERKNITSKAQIVAEQKRRQKQLNQKDLSKQASEDDLPTIPMYNWLDPANK